MQVLAIFVLIGVCVYFYVSSFQQSGEANDQPSETPELLKGRPISSGPVEPENELKPQPTTNPVIPPKGGKTTPKNPLTGIYKTQRTSLDDFIINFETTDEFTSYCKKLTYDTRPHVCFICGKSTEAYNCIPLTIKNFVGTSIDVHEECYKRAVSELKKITQNGTVDVTTSRSQELKAQITFVRVFQNGYPDDWETRRQAVLKRDKNRCQSCQSINVSLDVHHICPLNKKGSNALSNLQSLCLNCHEKKHNHPLRNNFDPYDSDVYELLATAVEKNMQRGKRKTRVRIDYEDRNGNESVRIIQPRNFENKWNSDYIYAFCETKGEYRLFKLSRIKDAEFVEE